MKKKKILFCYFSPREIHYTPTDIGYVVAILQQKVFNAYDFEIVQLDYEIVGEGKNLPASTQDKILQRDVDLIESHQPDAVFFFIESVLWSKVFALGRAKKVLREIRSRQSSLFTGLQSSKINTEQTRKVLDSNDIDCVITGDAEKIFVHLDAILEKKFLPGVEYKKVTYPRDGLIQLMERFETKSCNSVDALDELPSPYLEHVFDRYIQASQVQYHGAFRAFLVSMRGCSFGCYYCFRSTKFEKVQCFSVKRFYDELEYLFNTFKVHRFFVLDDAFLYSRKRLKEFEEEFRSRLISNPGLEKIDLFVMARPETVDEEIMKTLSYLNVKHIQFGLQTINPDLQHYMRRKIDVFYFKKIKHWSQEYNIKLYLDIVVGLPGDTSEWLKATMRYALLLDPFFLQIKQFYLNPATLFEVKQSEYDIEIQQEERDFNAPYVVKAKNIDEAYFNETNDFIMKQIEENPQVIWKYITNKKTFLSDIYTQQKNNVHELESYNKPPQNTYYSTQWCVKNIKGVSFKSFSAVDDTRIYHISEEGVVLARNQNNGKTVWAFKIPSLNLKKNFSSSLVLEKGKLYFGWSDGNIYCLDAKTGARIWVSLESDWKSSPIIVIPEQGLLFTGAEFGLFKKQVGVIALDIKNGNKKQEHLISCSSISSLIHVSEKDMLVVGGCDGSVHSFNITLEKVNWVSHVEKDKDSALILDSKKTKVVFVSSEGELCAIGIQDGKVKTFFQGKYKAGNNFCLSEESVIFSCIDNSICCVDLESGKLVWRVQLEGGEVSHVSRLDGNIFAILNDGKWYEIDAKKGKIVTYFNPQEASGCSLIYNPDTKYFFVTTYLGEVYCLSRQTIVYLFADI